MGASAVEQSGTDVRVSGDANAADLIGLLNGQVAGLLSVAASRMPLYQLMARVLDDSEQR
jgi:hypothetical protein